MDLSTSDLFGFRAIQGGVDSFAITQPMHTITPTKLLTLQVLASDAARYVVDNDFDNPDVATRRLLRLIDEGDTADSDVQAQLEWLHRRILGEDPEPDDVALSQDLFRDTFARRGDVRTAWTVVISTLLQEPRVLFY